MPWGVQDGGSGTTSRVTSLSPSTKRVNPSASATGVRPTVEAVSMRVRATFELSARGFARVNC